MTTAILEKPKRDKKTIEVIQNESGGLCEYVNPESGLRCNEPAYGEPHHVRTRGSGGADIRENLIHLCGEHHSMFHNGNIDRHHLIEVVAKREGKTVEEIYDHLKISIPENVEPIRRPKEIPSIEELIQAYIQIDEQEQETRWTKGKLLDVMLADEGISQKWLSSQLGVSPSQIRELVKVYRAFPDERTRIPSLSWYHHRVAANSSDPAHYIAKANDEGLSTREMREVILLDENKEHLTNEEKENAIKEAEKVFEKVESLLAKGGEPARWLEEKLRKLVI